MLVCRAEREVQEALRIEQRCGYGLEALARDLQCDLGSALAFGVAPHAVDGDHQRSFVTDDRPDAILVGLACAQKA